MFPGCTDPAAVTYRSIANEDDGSCEYAGCLDSNATDYNPSATLPMLCTYERIGCMHSNATNYNPLPTRATFAFRGLHGFDAGQLRFPRDSRLGYASRVPRMHDLPQDGVPAGNYHLSYARRRLVLLPRMHRFDVR